MAVKGLSGAVVSSGLRRYSFLYDFTALGGSTAAKTLTAADGSVLQLAAGAVVLSAAVQVVTLLVGGVGSTVNIGVTGSTSALLAANVLATLGLDVVQSKPLLNGFASATATSVLLTPAVNALTAGRLFVHILASDPGV